eukprot:Gb_36442 [translate_table: standard]
MLDQNHNLEVGSTFATFMTYLVAWFGKSLLEMQIMQFAFIMYCNYNMHKLLLCFEEAVGSLVETAYLECKQGQGVIAIHEGKNMIHDVLKPLGAEKAPYAYPGVSFSEVEASLL